MLLTMRVTLTGSPWFTVLVPWPTPTREWRALVAVRFARLTGCAVG